MANVDPERNVVVLEVEEAGKPRKVLGHGPTRDDRCVEVIVSAILRAGSVAPGAVTRVYSEWEPTASDTEYLSRALPAAQVTYSFSRPTDGDWQGALAQARAIMSEHTRGDGTADVGSFVELPTPSEPKRWWQFWK